jgi:hypothetical protein
MIGGFSDLIPEMERATRSFFFLRTNQVLNTLCRGSSDDGLGRRSPAVERTRAAVPVNHFATFMHHTLRFFFSPQHNTNDDAEGRPENRTELALD